MIPRLPEEVLHSLRGLNTCRAANAIECFDLQLRNEGFVNSTHLHCHYPALPPMLGYALTLRVRSANPPMGGGAYMDRTDWWTHLAALPGPHVVVIEDIDHKPGAGAFIGHVHSAILQALGCVGAVTNGAVRDLPSVEPMGFHLFSGNVSPSHAYVHVVEFGGTVNIAGLRVQPGELLLGDRHGLVRIPPALAPKLQATAARLQAQDHEIVDYCSSKDFTLEGLKELVSRRRSP